MSNSGIFLEKKTFMENKNILPTSCVVLYGNQGDCTTPI